MAKEQEIKKFPKKLIFSTVLSEITPTKDFLHWLTRRESISNLSFALALKDLTGLRHLKSYSPKFLLKYTNSTLSKKRALH